MNLSADLFLTFAKIGLFTFGGGYAMLPMIEQICVEEKQWITHDDMMNITVIAESTPGPVAVNCATFVGFRQKKVPGAIIATCGMVLPSFVIIYIIAILLDHFLEIAIVANAFKGIKLAVGLLILDAAIRMFKKTEKKPLPILIMALSALLMLAISLFSLSFSSIGIMLCAGVFSLVVFAIQNLRRKAGAPRE